MISIEQLKSTLLPICERFGVAYVDTFGSLARNELDEKSDIDLVIKFKDEGYKGFSSRFFGFIGAIEAQMNHKADVLTEESLTNPYLIEAINKDRVRVCGS